MTYAEFEEHFESFNQELLWAIGLWAVYDDDSARLPPGEAFAPAPDLGLACGRDGIHQVSNFLSNACL